MEKSACLAAVGRADCGLFYKTSNGAPSGLIVSITFGPTDYEANKIAFGLRLRVHGAPAGRSVSVPLLSLGDTYNFRYQYQHHQPFN